MRIFSCSIVPRRESIHPVVYRHHRRAAGAQAGACSLQRRSVPGEGPGVQHGTALLMCNMAIVAGRSLLFDQLVKLVNQGRGSRSAKNLPKEGPSVGKTSRKYCERLMRGEQPLPSAARVADDAAAAAAVAGETLKTETYFTISWSIRAQTLTWQVKVSSQCCGVLTALPSEKCWSH
jgi:hypothetical protein